MRRWGDGEGGVVRAKQCLSVGMLLLGQCAVVCVCVRARATNGSIRCRESARCHISARSEGGCRERERERERERALSGNNVHTNTLARPTRIKRSPVRVNPPPRRRSPPRHHSCAAAAHYSRPCASRTPPRQGPRDRSPRSGPGIDTARARRAPR